MRLPIIRDFTGEGTDPACYAVLDADWWVAIADVVASTRLVAAGYYRDINFVAAAVVASLSDVLRCSADDIAACQFGGDGAIAAVPPECRDAAEAALTALAHWSRTDMGIPLRVGLVPVHALQAAGHDTLVALHHCGADNAFGLFLGSGAGAAETWVKTDARWRLDPCPGPQPGLDGLSCRWQPIPSHRGTVLCVIVDPVRAGADGPATLARLQHEIERIVPTATAAPLGTGERLKPRWPPALRALALEARAAPRGRRLRRAMRALTESAMLWFLHRTGRCLGNFDPARYRREMAEQSDFRRIAGGPRFVLDVTEAEAAAIWMLLERYAAAGEIRFGMARAEATTITCLVGDPSSERHVHFVDGGALGFWRAATELKAKSATSPAAPPPASLPCPDLHEEPDGPLPR
jgi:hypothetical protein